MTRPWPDSPDEMRRIYELAVTEHGRSHAIPVLSGRYGIPDRTLRRVLDRAGIVIARNRVERPSGEDLGRAYAELAAQELPWRIVPLMAEMYEVAGTTARQWLIDAGLHEPKERAPRQRVAGACPCGASAVARYQGEEPPLCMPCYHKRRMKSGAVLRRNGRLEVAAFKKDKPCADCGVVYPPCVMDLDHVPERGPKSFHLAQPERNLKEVRAELAKCDLVCANCHRIRTWKRRQAKNAQAAS